MKLNKRVTFSAATVLGLGALITIFGTTAFFKDTTSKTNVFTVGNVTLDVTELQRDPNGDYSTSCDADDLVEFDQEKVIAPIIGSEGSGHYDACHMPDVAYTKNYGDKIVTVENTGNSEAYVRAYVAVPETLDNKNNATDNLLHFNFGRNSENKKTDNTIAGSTGDWLWKDTSGNWKYYDDANFTIGSLDGTTTTTTKYAIYYADYKEKLAAHTEAPRLLNGVYLDENITDITRTVADTAAGGTTTITKGGTNYTLDFNVDKYGLQMPIYIVAVQADGFDNAQAAFDAALGANWKPTFSVYNQ